MVVRSFCGLDRTRITVSLSPLVLIVPSYTSVEIRANASEPLWASSIFACHCSAGVMGCFCSHPENRMREPQQEAVCIVTCEIPKTSLFCIRNRIHSIKTFLWKYILINLIGLDSDHHMLRIGIRG